MSKGFIRALIGIKKYLSLSYYFSVRLSTQFLVLKPHILCSETKFYLTFLGLTLDDN